MSKDYSKLRNGSDVRGVALEGVEGEEVTLTPDAAYDLGRGFVSWLAAHAEKDASELVIAIGRDSRLSGLALAASLAEGIRACGAEVLDCGLATTPAMFMSCIFDEFDADGSVMVTASHLPWNRNGLKFFAKTGGLEAEDIKEICDVAGEDPTREYVSDELEPTSIPGRVIRRDDLLACYASHLRKLISEGLDSAGAHAKPLSGLKIAVDAGNGAGGFYATEVLEPLGADVSASQFLEPDGSFPNHIPNPEDEAAMEAICSAVSNNACDLGLIFDTDVDRSSAVDEHGREINRNAIVALAAVLAANGHPGTTVVTDSITSNELADFLEDELGLVHLRYQRGYRNVINKMIELNEAGQDCQLAIETSGHAAFHENYDLDDGAYLATKIVIKAAELKAEGKSISELTSGLKEAADAREVRMSIHAEDFASVADGVLEQVDTWAREKASERALELARERFGEGVEQVVEVVEPNYEGIRVAFSGAVNGWFLLRKSLHDPLMPLNIETSEEGGVEFIVTLLREVLEPIAELDTEKL